MFFVSFWNWCFVRLFFLVNFVWFLVLDLVLEDLTLSVNLILESIDSKKSDAFSFHFEISILFVYFFLVNFVWFLVLDLAFGDLTISVNLIMDSIYKFWLYILSRFIENFR